MPPIRLFIAADITEAQRAIVLDLMEDLRKGIQFTQAHPTWVGPAGLHLTVKFLGNVEEKRVGQIVRAVQGRLSGAPAFDCSLGGLGVFPDPRNPKVLWLGVRQGKDQLADLADRVDAALAPLGFEPERRAHHPHLTLARIKALRGAGQMMDVVAAHRAAEAGAGRVGELTLYQSELKPEGAQYTVLHRWELGKPEAS